MIYKFKVEKKSYGGLDLEIKSGVDDAKNQVYSREIEAVLTGGLIVLAQSQDLTPVNTARLVNSLTVQTNTFDSGFSNNPGKKQGIGVQGNDKISKPNNAVTAHVGTNVEYASDVEFGTYKQEAQSYLRKALELKKKQVLDKAAEILKKAL